MPRSSFALAGIFGAILAIALTSCAGSPQAAPAVPGTPSLAPANAQPEPVTAPAPQKKERIVVTKVPVLVKETTFYPDGLVDEYVLYSYDAGKRLLLERSAFDASRPEPIERRTYDYLPDGKERAELVYDAEGKLSQGTESAYDAAGRLSSEKSTDAKGQPSAASSYAYDEAGRRKEWKAFDARGLLKASIAYTYNGAGRPLLMELRDAAGNLTSTIRFEYAGTGQVEKKSYFAPNGSLQKYEILDFQDGKARRYELHRPDDSLVEARNYEYGSLGELLVVTAYDAANRLRERIVYEYLVREDQSTEVYYE